MQPLIVPGRLDSLAAVSDYVKAAATAAGLDAGATYRLRLAAAELVTNVIEHGYADHATPGPVELRADISPTTLRLIIEDAAIPYDPRTTAAPDDLHLPPEQRDIGGLGVYLVLQDVDGFEYEYVDGKNRSTVVMKRHPGV